MITRKATTRKAIASSMIAVAGAIPVAVALCGTAAAEPATPPAPALPAVPFINQLASAPQLLQGLASVLSGGTTTPAPAAAAPGATAAITLPAAPAAPVAAPAAAPAAAPGLVPSAQVTMPDTSLLPVPLPQNVNFPGDLASLMPVGLQVPGLTPKTATGPSAPTAATTVTAPVTTPRPATAPPSTGGGLPPMLMPLSALP